jgi:hypothetical protein
MPTGEKNPVITVHDRPAPGNYWLPASHLPLPRQMHREYRPDHMQHGEAGAFGVPIVDQAHDEHALIASQRGWWLDRESKGGHNK